MKAKAMVLTMLWIVLLSVLALTPAKAEKDSLKIAFVSKFHTMEPYQTSARQMLQMGYLIWDPLVLRHPDTGKILPHVATSWKTVDDRTWEFKIRGDDVSVPGRSLGVEPTANMVKRVFIRVLFWPFNTSTVFLSFIRPRP